MGSKRKSGDEPALQAAHREFRESCKGGQVKAHRNMQKIVQRFQKREGIRSKVKLGKREKRKQESTSQDPDEKVPKGSRSSGCVTQSKARHLQTWSVNPTSFHTRLQPRFPTLPASRCLPPSSKGPRFSSLKSSYLFTEQSPWLWHSGQSPEETVQYPRTQEELPCPKSRSLAFPPLLWPLHRRSGTKPLPPPACSFSKTTNVPPPSPSQPLTQA